VNGRGSPEAAARVRSGSWSSMERMTLRALLPETPLLHIARQIGRSEEVVARQIETMASPRRGDPFSPDDDDYLRRGFGALELRLLALLMGRTQTELRQRARQLRSKKRRGRWSADDLVRLKAWYATRRDRDLEVSFSRAAADIRRKAQDLGLGRDKAVAAARGETTRMPRWSEQELAELARLYPRLPNVEVARRLGRSVTSVATQGRRLGLAKSEATRSKLARRSVAMRRFQA
jgi:hypothetical protein